MTDETRQQIEECLALRDATLGHLAPESTSAYVLKSTIRVNRQKIQDWQDMEVSQPEITESFSDLNAYTLEQKQELHDELVEVYDEMAALIEG